MLAEVIKKQLKEFMQSNMPHALLPQAVYARVVKGGREKVDLRILNQMGGEDEQYQVLPDIETEFPYEKDDIVLISFIYGELEQPVIIRKQDHLPQVRFAKITKGGKSDIHLKLLNKDEEIDEQYPEIINVKNDFEVKEGDKVLISFLHCELKNPVIIRKYGD